MRDDSGDSIRARNKALEGELATLRDRLEALRSKYDRYFMGLERIPPDKIRSELARDLRNSKLENTHKTAMKFRFNNVRQRMNTYTRYWDRIMRLIEEGRFKRERGSLQKMGGPPAAPPDEPGGGGGAEKERAVYDSWKKAQTEVGRSSDVDFERFQQKLAKQRQAQKDKFGWDDVSYSVRVKDGKVALVAKPADQDDDE